MTWFKRGALPLFALHLLLGWGAFAAAEETSPSGNSKTPAVSNEELLKRMDAMEAEIKDLKSQVKNYQDMTKSPIPVETPKKADESLFGLGSQSKSALKIGSYGELKFGEQQTPGGWHNGFDAARVVLLPSYQFTDNIIFNAEIEFEHGGINGGSDDKLGGGAEIEQAYVDFKFNDFINWRAPGVDVVPFGYINLFHEPSQFYSVNRPELYNGLIPSTWFEGATSLYGKIVDNLNYQFQISSGLEDTGTTGSDLPPFPGTLGGYGGGITSIGDHAGLGNAHAPIGDFNQTGSNLGFALRLSYDPPFVPGLSGSTSVYFTPNTTPRGAYGDNGVTPFALGTSSLTLFDTELRYRLPKTGFEFRGEYVQAFIGNPANLRVNNDGDPTDNVGDSMYGFSLETAYHWNLAPKIKNGWEVVPFYRYTYENLQTGGFRGNDSNAPTGAGRLQFHTLGLAFFPIPELVLKIDYQFALDDAPNSPKSDHFLGSVGWFF